MTLSVEDEVTLVELAVIVLGILLTWAVYRLGPQAVPSIPSAPGTPPRGVTPSAGPGERGGAA